MSCKSASNTKSTINNDNSMSTYDARHTLLSHNIIVGHKIDTTLQGSIYKGSLVNFGCRQPIDVVIKRADIKLHKLKLGRIGNKRVPVGEDIIKEAKIMAYLSSLNAPKGFIKLYRFINDGKNYFMIMDNGGKSLFRHVKEYHLLINKKELSINEWKNHVKIIFKQLVKMVYFLHNKARVCHMDISLENILIKGCVFKNGKFVKHGSVSFCDFGLAEYFDKTNPNFICSKHVGKTAYQAPEVFSHKSTFDARKGDIWSLGITLFMLQLFVQPLSIPCLQDNYFRNIINGYLYQMIKDNGKAEYCSKWFVNIVNNLLTLHQRRFDINSLVNSLNIKM